MSHSVLTVADVLKCTDDTPIPFHFPLKMAMVPYTSQTCTIRSPKHTPPRPRHAGPHARNVPGMSDMRKEHEEVGQADRLLLGGDTTPGDHPDQGISHGIQQMSQLPAALSLLGCC